jgi:predicted RNA binding protein YcfA (HicA-like mRNA interferase family)
MKIPRDVDSLDLIERLSNFDYVQSRQQGSHIRLTTNLKGQHHITIPKHASIKIGTLNSILKDVSEQFKISKDEVIRKIFSE